ncbi:MAG: hypothetical protein KDI71_20175 [Xanthomonadales bacterium]|nr:hypothetical protein [Xanthomonadales bacterium]
MENKKHGGARPGGGRPKGSPNKATKIAKRTITELAQSHGPTALSVLVEIATTGESQSARVPAANALLDRGYGRVRQPLDVDVTGAPVVGAVQLYLPHNGREPAPIEGAVTRQAIGSEN